MACSTIVLGLWRVVKAARAVPRHTGKMIGILVVLAAQPLVIIQLGRQVHLVAGAAQLRGPVDRLEEGPPVQLRPGLDELAVEPSEEIKIFILPSG